MTHSAEMIRKMAADPVLFAERIIGVEPDPEQAAILNSLVENTMTTVRSGHGVGKSAVEAWAVIWFLCTRPYPKVPCTAPTQHQLCDILWAEIAKWIRNSKYLQEALVWTREKVYMKGQPEEWFAVARTASQPDALQGFHAEHLLYIIDEASGVDDEIFEPVLGTLTTKGARLLMCGNPTQLRGFFYESHTKNRSNYQTFHIDGRESKRVPPGYVERIERMYGADSDVFRVRVAGEFPLQENDIFIPLSLVEKSIRTEPERRERPQSIHIGVDVARFGGDKTCIGYKVDEVARFYKKINGQNTMRTADDIIALGMDLERRYKLDPATDDPIPVKVDDSGVGGGVTDRLRQLKEREPDRFWWLDICPVMFGQRIKHKYYYDTTTYMMAIVKNLLQPYDDNGAPKPIELILPDDDDLVAQLSGRKYGMTENGKIRVESKEAVKKRGNGSPDEADCILLLCLPIRPKKTRRGGEKPNELNF